jgi:hypothetical protein
VNALANADHGLLPCHACALRNDVNVPMALIWFRRYRSAPRWPDDRSIGMKHSHDNVEINLVTARVLMTAWCRRPIPQFAAITGAMLLLNLWGGVPPVHSQTGHGGPVVTPMEPPVRVPMPEVGSESAPRPESERGSPSPWWYSLSMETRQQIQMALRYLHYYQGPIDGLFGQQTRQAIVSYQSLVRARPTGYLTAEEVAHLLQGYAQRPQLSPPAPGCAGPRFLSG